MFLGHFGVGFAAKRVAPRTSLGTLFLAAQFIDLLWPTLLLMGLEHIAISPGITRATPLDFTDYPISHSLLTVFLWAILFSGVYYLLQRYPRGAWVCGISVISHWVLDLLVHRPDLPLVPGRSYRVGLGLWNSLPATLAVELCIFTAGIVLYCRLTKASDRKGSIGLWALVVFLLLVYFGNIFGQPPPNVNILAWFAQAQWLLVIWAYWIDRHREIIRTA